MGVPSGGWGSQRKQQRGKKGTEKGSALPTKRLKKIQCRSQKKRRGPFLGGKRTKRAVRLEKGMAKFKIYKSRRKSGRVARELAQEPKRVGKKRIWSKGGDQTPRKRPIVRSTTPEAKEAISK